MINALRRNPFFMKLFINTYAPYVGAGVKVTRLDIEQGAIDVVMPLTRFNKNYVGTQFGGSLYSMVDPFLMLILINRLGKQYVVWDKAASIDFKAPGRGTVKAEIRISDAEIASIIEAAAEGKAVLRTYPVEIRDDSGLLICQVDKVLYIRKKREATTP